MLNARRFPFACCLLAVATAGPQVITAIAAEPQPTKLNAVALVDTVGGRGDLIEVRSDDRGVRSATATWTAGVTSRIPAWTRKTKVASFVIIDDAGTRKTGNLWSQPPSGKNRPTIRLRSPTATNLLVELRGGHRPQLKITATPAGTRSIGITTVAEGRNLLRRTARCANKRKRESSSIAVSLGDGAQHTIKRNGTSTCGDGIPTEP